MIWAAFILGLVSSFHCVGMCGPLAMSLPVQNMNPARKTMAIVLYHAGRVITYSLLGLLFGLLGRHLFIAGYQRWVSISLGIIILLVIAWQKLFRHYRLGFVGEKFTAMVSGWMRYAWNHHSAFSSLLFGMLNGLLPCGMVYYALAGAFGMGSLSGGIYFMMFFGMGTLPLMLSVHFFGNAYLTASIRTKLRKLVPVFIGFMGLLLILRGLNLGIPYISPTLASSPSQAVICH